MKHPRPGDVNLLKWFWSVEPFKFVLIRILYQTLLDDFNQISPKALIKMAAMYISVEPSDREN